MLVVIIVGKDKGYQVVLVVDLDRKKLVLNETEKGIGEQVFA